jgi:hypothetical protein
MSEPGIAVRWSLLQRRKWCDLAAGPTGAYRPFLDALRGRRIGAAALLGLIAREDVVADDLSTDGHLLPR